MENKTGMSQQYKNILLISLAVLNAKERAERAESDELLLQTDTFLLQYAFLLEPASEIDNFLKPKNAPAGEIYSENAGNLPGMGGIYNHINGDLYHYAGNNPVRYIDPDGRKTSSLTDKQWDQVFDALSRLSANLETIIKSLNSVDRSTDLSIFNKKIVEAAKFFIKSNFGDGNYDFKGLAYQLSRVKLRIDSLTRADFLYNDKMNSYAWTYPFFSKQINLGNKFLDARMTGGYDTKEGIILHEVTHQFSLFGTIDITYNFAECKTLSNFWKRNNANNWEYFYEAVYSF